MIGSTLSAFSGGNIGTTRATPISARRFTRSTSSPRPNEVISMDAGSRPASRAISRNFGRTSASIAAGRRDPAIAVADRAPRAMREGAADMDRRVRLLHRLRPGHHRIEIDELAVIFRLAFVQISFIASICSRIRLKRVA